MGLTTIPAVDKLEKRGLKEIGGKILYTHPHVI